MNKPFYSVQVFLHQWIQSKSLSNPIDISVLIPEDSILVAVLGGGCLGEVCIVF